MYLQKLICSNNVLQKYELNIFIHCSEITPPQFDRYGNLSNPEHAGKMFSKNGYFLPNVFSMVEGWPSALAAFKWTMPNLKIRLFAVCNQMLSFNNKGIAGYSNPIELVSYKTLQDGIYVGRYYSEFNELIDHFDIQNHWDIKYIYGFVAATENSIVYTAPYVGTAALNQKAYSVLSKMECQNTRVIESPKYIHNLFLQTYGFHNPKELIKELVPEYYPENLNADDFYQAKNFLLKHQHIVMKMPNLVGGDKVYFYNIRDKSKKEITQITAQFKETFYEMLTESLQAGQNYIIIQKFIEGINQYGETRIYIINGKVLPIGINIYGQEDGKVFKPDKGAKSRDIYLSEEYLDVAKKFLDAVHHKLDFFYYGLDVIRHVEPDNKVKFYILEANYGTVGFFPRISAAIRTQHDEINEYIATLDPRYKDLICINFLDSLIYKPLYEQIHAKKQVSTLVYPEPDLYGPPINQLMIDYFSKKSTISKTITKIIERRTKILAKMEQQQKKNILQQAKKIKSTSQHLVDHTHLIKDIQASAQSLDIQKRA